MTTGMPPTPKKRARGAKSPPGDFAFQLDTLATAPVYCCPLKLTLTSLQQEK